MLPKQKVSGDFAHSLQINDPCEGKPEAVSDWIAFVLAYSGGLSQWTSRDVPMDLSGGLCQGCLAVSPSLLSSSSLWFG